MSQRTLHERVEWIGSLKFIRLKSGRLVGFWDAITAAERAHTALGRELSRAFKLADDEWDLERIEWRVDHLETHIGAIRKELQKRRGKLRVEERIALLRNTDGRTPEEAEAFRRKADELERRLVAG